MLMSVRYRWTGDVDENRLWVRELYTYVNYIQTCTKRTVNVRARLHYDILQYSFYEHVLQNTKYKIRILGFDAVKFHLYR